jgi:hypothetical protein
MKFLLSYLLDFRKAAIGLAGYREWRQQEVMYRVPVAQKNEDKLFGLLYLA